MTTRYKALRGTRDILPDEVAGWRFLEETARNVLQRYMFREVRTPILEATHLFARSVGESTDIVRKEMYTFRRGGDSMTLRPENTASVVRAFVEHALHRNVAVGYPERYFYIGPMFRHERPQKGRQRQFHQIGVELLGSSEAAADAEVVEMVDALLEALGIDDRELVLSSVGDEQCRPAYREELRRWLEPRLDTMCEDCRRRATDNPLRVLDCKVESDQRLLAEAPSLVERLCAACEEHFGEVRSLLAEAGVACRVAPRLVRGLDYYRRTVFEALSGGLGAQNAILGGGRYDGLVQELGGPPIPGVGFAMGMERTILLLEQSRLPRLGADVALILMGAAAQRAGLALARRLRRAGLSVLAPLVSRPMGAQLRRADRAGARYALFVGDDELARGAFGLKDLQSGEQQTLDERAILDRLVVSRPLGASDG